MKILYDVPLFTQYWNLDNWNNLDFKSWEEAEYWQRSCCGILCIKEVATYLNKHEYSTPSLINLGQELNGYSDKYGWNHDGLVRLATRLSLNAERYHMNVTDLKKALDIKKLPIVSIKWAFKNTKSLKEKLLFWKKYGGHLVVVVGYDEDGFYVNHTSKIKEQNWKAGLVPYEKFTSSYTGRAILVWK